MPVENAFFESLIGHPVFPVRQTSHSLSRRDVVRGVHYTATPPGSAKHVYCPRGRSLDVVVDLRVGSPTYGRSDAVVLDALEFRSVYLPVGVGHMTVALEDDTVMAYLWSEAYRAERERAVSALDPELGLPVPERPVLSERDRAAPTLAEARAAGLLPDYAACRAVERTWRVAS
uniref:PyrC12 n=1 Tax=Streptomyces rugosporus TaxID=295838 RepID=K7QQB4_STRRG|nr:PyrC12 [Streptomyces rugosporus]